MKMVELLMDMDTLLASDKHFLLGRWLADAASWGTDMAEKFLMLYNARNQITLWGPSGEVCSAMIAHTSTRDLYCYNSYFNMEII